MGFKIFKLKIGSLSNQLIARKGLQASVNPECLGSSIHTSPFQHYFAITYLKGHIHRRLWWNSVNVNRRFKFQPLALIPPGVLKPYNYVLVCGLIALLNNIDPLVYSRLGTLYHGDSRLEGSYIKGGLHRRIALHCHNQTIPHLKGLFRNVGNDSKDLRFLFILRESGNQSRDIVCPFHYQRLHLRCGGIAQDSPDHLCSNTQRISGNRYTPPTDRVPPATQLLLLSVKA